jgi:hypothetical protein
MKEKIQRLLDLNLKAPDVFYETVTQVTNRINDGGRYWVYVTSKFKYSRIVMQCPIPMDWVI